MSFVLQPWQFFLIGLAGWINGHQQQIIEYLITENQVLKEKIGKKRILLNDDQRRRLAVKGKVLGRKLLHRVATIVTPDTVLRWHRKLIAMRYDRSASRGLGRPRVAGRIRSLAVPPRLSQQMYFPTVDNTDPAFPATNRGATLCIEPP